MYSTWFITGASRGLGRELTEQALARGDRFAATLRTPSQLDELAVVHGDRLWVRQLDVTDTIRMGHVVKEAFTDHEHIDGVVSNAGIGVFGAAEDLTNDQVEQMIATNLTACIGYLGHPFLKEALWAFIASLQGNAYEPPQARRPDVRGSGIAPHIGIHRQGPSPDLGVATDPPPLIPYTLQDAELALIERWQQIRRV